MERSHAPTQCPEGLPLYFNDDDDLRLTISFSLALGTCRPVAGNFPHSLFSILNCLFVMPRRTSTLFQWLMFSRLQERTSVAVRIGQGEILRNKMSSRPPHPSIRLHLLRMQRSTDHYDYRLGFTSHVKCGIISPYI